MPNDQDGSTDPKRTIELLNKLGRLGFNDQAFERLHHMGLGETIARHRDYCERTHRFLLDSNNARTQERLELVLDAYRCAGFKSGKHEVFVALAKAARAEIPTVEEQQERTIN
jgi:hypothetical protein